MISEEHTIQSSTDDFARSAWLVKSSDSPRRLCVFLDGEHYRDQIDPVGLLEGPTQKGQLPPMACVFIAHGGAAARHTDYVCNPQFARFIAEDVVGWARESVPTLSEGGHLVCGLSLSGLAAAHIALLYPQKFPAALCQSGSFWFEPASFARLAQQRPPTKTRFWLSVGDEETDENVAHPPTGLFQNLSQIEGVEQARRALEHNGGQVHHHLYGGGHTFDPWRAEFEDAVRWLMQPGC